MDEQHRLKVMTLFGTRPEIIKLSRIFAKLDAYVQHIMVHTGQSFDTEMSDVFFADLKIRQPDYFLGVRSETLGGQIANILVKSEEVFKKERPDALLILGDTNSALAAIIAKRMGIPIFHMEAGNRSFDERVPEEINRRIVDHLSDINLPYTEHGRQNLLREGLPPSNIFVTGSPMAEVFEHEREAIERSAILERLALAPQKYIVVSIHREEHVEHKAALEEIFHAVNAVARVYDLPVILSAHPRTAKRIEEYGLLLDARVRLQKPFGFFDYVALQMKAFCVLSDSGTLAEEASLLGFPAVHVRRSTERPEAFDAGCLILSGLEEQAILRAVDVVTKQRAAGETFAAPSSYQDLNVSGKALRHIVGLAPLLKRAL